MTGKLTGLTGQPKPVLTSKLTGEPKPSEITEREPVVPLQSVQLRDIGRRLGIGTGAKDKDAVKLDAITSKGWQTWMTSTRCGMP